MTTPAATLADASTETNQMTKELDALARKYGCVIVGEARITPIDMEWDAPDAEQWAQYGVTADGRLVRGFWNV